MSMTRIGIVGTGMVGGALQRYYQSIGVEPLVYDKGKSIGSMDDVNQADIIFVCVPTPFYLDEGGFDLSYVRAALATIKDGKVVVMKSTMVPGTTAALQAEYPQFTMLYNPEFLVEKFADRDTAHPDRQIIGVTKVSAACAEQVLALLPQAPYVRIVSSTEAELIKYFGNTFLSLRVTFANQMYDLCQKMGAEYDLVRDGIAADARIGPSHFDVFYGDYRGYGGKCLPKDTRALIQFGERMGVPLTLLEAAEKYNNALCQSQGIDIRWEEGSPKKT